MAGICSYHHAYFNVARHKSTGEYFNVARYKNTGEYFNVARYKKHR
jgi:hypothetical protein